MTQLPGPGRRQPQLRVTGGWQGRPHAVSGQRTAGLRQKPWRHCARTGSAALVIGGAAAGIVLLALHHAGHRAAHAVVPVAPPRLAACARSSPVPCYAQDPLHEVYGTGALYRRGITGEGTTIAVIMPDASAGVAGDLAVFSRHFRLPAARLEFLSWDHAPADSARDPDVDGWEEEGALDLEMAHFMAPGARLVYVRIPVSAGPYETGELSSAMTALRWLATRQRVDVVSFSWGLYEADLARSGGYGQLAGLRAGLKAAVGAGVSVVAGSGDSGPTGPDPAGRGYYPFRTVPWPTSDPLVTGVAGVNVDFTARGVIARPETVGRQGSGFAAGGGLSAVFPRPAYQDRVASVAGDRRGVVDVSMDARAWAYIRVPGLRNSPGWFYVSGTSVSAPLLAGIVADAAQLAGRPLGLVNPALYRMHGSADGVLDITHGTNTDHGVPGYQAAPGYDLPSGIGTVGNAALFVPALARLDQHT
jgi:subtilase family serine protease